MNLVRLKMLIKESLDENSEVALANTNRLIDSATTVEDLLNKLIGKRLKDLLDMASFARLYVMNKYGIGSMPAKDDIKANVSDLLTSIVDYINFRKLDKMNIERDAFEKERHNTPEYKEWLSKRNTAFKKLFMARRTNNQPSIDIAQSEYNDIMASEPNRDDYEKNRSDREQTVHEFHNRQLTLDDIMPQSDDTEADKQRYKSIVKAFSKLKNMNESIFTRLAKQMIVENDGTNVTVQVYTGGGRGGTTLLLYRGDARGSERSSDKHYKTPTQFVDLLRTLDNIRGTTMDEQIKNILRKLTSDELEQLKNEKIIVTNNVEV